MDLGMFTLAPELRVPADFDAAAETDRRIQFLSGYLVSSGLRCLVLGISGGVDSTTAGRLCQIAAERARGRGLEARFIAVRLPYGTQRDEADAQSALAFIRPDEQLTVDIQPTADALLHAVRAAPFRFELPSVEDFVLGNIKARQRMVAQ